MFVAAVSNCGAPCLLISGGSLKADNQWYNKKMAEEQSRVTKGGSEDENGVKTPKGFVMTPVAESIVRYRENRVHDFLFKCAARVLDWCVENRIDTLGMNYNDTWENDCNMRHESKQLFMEIPFARFRDILAMKCFWAGIRFEVREESFTSKASFLDNDPIPTFGSEDARGWVSSGRRVERGLFRSADGTLIHADLNGAANGLRKAYPDAFTRDGAVMPDFTRVRYLYHPDAEFEARNRELQLLRNDYSCVSRSRLRRERRKAADQIMSTLKAHRSGIVYVVPHGIELCE
jgi:putative transposase